MLRLAGKFARSAMLEMTLSAGTIEKQGREQKNTKEDRVRQREMKEDRRSRDKYFFHH